MLHIYQSICKKNTQRQRAKSGCGGEMKMEDWTTDEGLKNLKKKFIGERDLLPKEVY